MMPSLHVSFIGLQMIVIERMKKQN